MKEMELDYRKIQYKFLTTVFLADTINSLTTLMRHNVEKFRSDISVSREVIHDKPREIKPSLHFRGPK